jgi:tetratricopeptide (TPR) repeat protein
MGKENGFCFKSRDSFATARAVVARRFRDNKPRSRSGQRRNHVSAESDKEEAIELFKLNTEAYPASANAQDSLSDGYLAAGKNDLALAAEQKCLELLPADTNGAQFKTQLEQVAKEKIAKLKSEQK